MEGVYQFLKRFEGLTKNADLFVAVGLISILGVMLIPLPAIILDLSLTISLTIALLILLVAIYTKKPLDFSVFPSLLLMTTLFRLSLNVASTRLILAEGHSGVDAVGQVIKAFGSFVVGNNYVIGFIVFVILVVINFVVITKGSGRVAEVAARFTLDAMPGKQMSIDADLNSGLITEQEARNRRREIEKEADFYGAMDGASKFVRGDAIAGIIITLVNIIGGLLVGVLQKGLDISTAAQNYTMLTIGDGLVSQIPALIISTAAGTVVTRSTSDRHMGQEMAGQLFLNPRAVAIVGAIIGLLGMVPGLPKTPFFLISIIMGGVAWVIHRSQIEEREAKEQREVAEANTPKKDNVENLLPLDLVELEVGYGLINVVESEHSGDLLERIVSIRKQFALDLGIVVPSIHIRDNLQLEPGEYRIMIKGNRVAGGHLRADHYLAMDPGNVSQIIDGTPTKEPAFGLDALWISKSQREKAEVAGYTVVDLPTVMATHITEVIRAHAFELLGRQEADVLIENFKKSYPKVVDELIPDLLPFGTVVKVLQNLLKEQVSIRDLLTVFETLADDSTRTKDPEALTEYVRRALARSISSRFMDDQGTVHVLSLGPYIEEQIANSLIQTEQGIQLVMDPHTANDMIMQISSTIESHPEIAGQPVLMTSPTARRHIAKLTHRFIPQLTVLAHTELASDVNVTSVGLVELSHAS
ncbi:MAG: flagellar biosynthesis protein FlhA [Pseudobdellovibrionaceae bacterium]|nr:flagellar biosynthesis protein FlhA [Bdellovibrionales bacterium]USN47335.1 MAG: flagellar biosynthesis protein FlhA [Pseudobdellovibrionaceae bacterium]